MAATRSDAEGKAGDRRAGVIRSAIEALRAARSRLEAQERTIRELERRIDHVEREASRSIELRSTSDAFEGGLGNRPATESYRNTTIARFMQSVNELGTMARKFGPEVAEFAVRTVVRADAAMLYTTPPATLAEAERRDTLRVLLSNPASARLLAGTEEWHERFRQDVINFALNSGVEASTWEMFRRSAEGREEWTERGTRSESTA
ncbi:MAG: hypothetical protein ACHQ2Y_02810 [Candidatus Lutacidiplasmatales archaeon]